MGDPAPVDRCLPRPPPRRIEEAVLGPLVEKFSRSNDADHATRGREWGSGRTSTPDSDASGTPEDDPDPVDVDPATGGVRLRLGDETCTLSRAAAQSLRATLGAALTERREFVHTACRCREDGSYVVERRGADSAGHRKVFDSPVACRELYESLPAEFTATDLDAPGVSGGRRHMLVWHFAEHPRFDCELASRQPLTVRKRTAGEPTTGGTESREVAGD